MKRDQLANLELYETDDIIIGFGEVKANHDEDGVVYWVLPGNEVTYSKSLAEQYARRLHQMIHVNLKRYNRSLI